MFLGGDWRFFWPENIRDFAAFPSAWDSSLNTGIGKSALGTLWINSYLNFSALLTKFELSWDLISLLFWILPAILISFFSARYLFKTLFPDKSKHGLLSGLIFFLNTYFLLVITGGQLGVALAYSLFPLVFARFIKTIIKPNLANGVITGLVLSAQLLFDPRLTYISIFLVCLYFLFNYQNIFSDIKKQFIFTILIPFIVTLLLHSFWIIPLLVVRSGSLPVGFDSLQGLKFLSFANLENSISLLHPNWPENIFGKVYFMRPEFIILPILAYSSLIFMKRSNIKDKTSKTQIKNQKCKKDLTIGQLSNETIVIFFALIGLIGAFLAKGTNEPYGQVFEWLFLNIPGFVIFRDPTKWYLVVAMSYSILIPFSVLNISEWINSKLKIQRHLSYLVLIFTILCLLFLIRPLFLGQISGMRLRQVPNDYILLKKFLVDQPEFFRTLWIPQWQRYGYFSNIHPAIGRGELFQQSSPSGMIKDLSNPNIKKVFNDMSVSYIIVPYDSEGEIFLNDRKYSNTEYLNFIHRLKKISWLKNQQNIGRNIIFEIDKNNKGKFWVQGNRNNVFDYISDKPYEYKVNLKEVRYGDLLVFSESYDSNWVLENDSSVIKTKIYNNLLNSFVLTKNGNYSVKIYYKPQDWVNIGLIVSFITLTFTGIILVINKKKSKR